MAEKMGVARAFELAAADDAVNLSMLVSFLTD